jgi:hypothetical protein
MSKTVTEKIGGKKNMRSIFVNAPAGILPTIQSTLLDLKKNLTGKFDYIHLFVKSQDEMRKRFPKLMHHLQHPGMLWVSWPKSKTKITDLNIKTVIKTGYDCGLVESKCISLNSTWSALKFTWPKEKKVYNNSYGKLK